MGEDAHPNANCAFVYILSNASMNGVFKIGITTNRVSQRMRELNSTGVPTAFRAEKIFQVDDHFLEAVERKAHRSLTRQGFHHGKEFFNAPLDVCVQTVEDAIHDLTGEKSPDIVGLAHARAEVARAENERKSALEAAERERRHSERKALDVANAHMQRQQAEFIRNAKGQNAQAHSPWEFVAAAIGVVILGFGAFVFVVAFPPFIILFGGMIWWVIYQERVRDEDLRAQAEMRFPIKHL